VNVRAWFIAAIAVIAGVALAATAAPGTGRTPSVAPRVILTADRSRPSYELLGFTPVGARTAWTVTTGNQRRNAPQSVQRSTDGGAHWSNVTPPGLSRAGRRTAIQATDFLSAARAWVAYGAVTYDSPKTLLSTADGGRTWTRVGRLPSPSCTPQFVNAVDGWCVDIGGALGSEFVTIYRTTTAGRIWREVSRNGAGGMPESPNPIPFGCDKSVTFSSTTRGFASSVCNGGGGYIYATADGGARWHRSLMVQRTAGPSDGAAFTAVVASGNAAAAGYTVEGYQTMPTVSVVYRSANGGASWTAVRPPGPSAGYDVDIVTPKVWKLVAGRTVLGTDNAGRAWTRITANVALAGYSSVLFVTPLVGWEVDPASSSSNVRHTTDGGRRWTTVRVPQ
jgi:photosystem II stability/assembly factor-like uncharacterized protein